MRRVALSAIGFAIVLTGCNRGPTVVVAPPLDPALPAAPAAVAPIAAPPVVPAFPALELSPQQRYDAAVWNAFTLLTDHKYAEALSALEQAQRIQNGDLVRQEIAEVKGRLDVIRDADRTIRDIQAILAGGAADESARLAATALREYGASEKADTIIRLKRQADALVAVSLDGPARVARFRREAEDATRAGSLRAAAVAYEQCVAAGDASAWPRLSFVRAGLDRYDDARRQAMELRRTPGQLEGAIAALKTAAAAWDTPEVRQELAECTFAILARRPPLSIAEFDISADVGAPLLGQSIAEELAPAFKPQYDVVDVNQVASVRGDLNLASTDILGCETGRRELARLANIRYLVMGSVVHADGLVVRARLVDLQTGAIVQTARVVAATMTDLVALLPQLAVMLQMGDDQRLAYEQQLAHQAAAVAVVSELTDVPPLPEKTSATTSPIVFTTSRPPDPGGVLIEDFRQLTAPPSPDQTADAMPLATSMDHKVLARGLNVTISLGDELFQRGRYQESQAQFRAAMNLAPEQKEIQARLDLCKTKLPPDATSLPLRLAVFDFVTDGNPALLPPGLGTWAAEMMSPYLSPPYDLVDRGTVNWYMGSLGVTLRDAVVDPVVRRYLGRALNVRFVVLGSVHANANSLQVVAHLLDTETGTQVSTATAIAHDLRELKWQIGQIAQWLLLDPAERTRRQNDAAEIQTLLLQAEAAAKLSNFSLAIELTRKAGQKSPGIRVEVLLNQFNRQSKNAALEAERRSASDKNRALAAAAALRRQELAAAANTARVAAAGQAASIDAPERQRRRDLAYRQLIGQAQAASDAQDLAMALELYDSALAIDRKSQAVLDREKVQARAADLARNLGTIDSVRRQAAIRQDHAADVARVRAQIDAERRQQAAANQGRRQAQAESDARESTRLLAEAQRLESKGDYDSAVRALQTAKRLHPTDEVDRRLNSALVLRTRATAQRPNDPSRRDLDAKLAAETDARSRAEAKRQADLLAKADADAKARAKADADAKGRAAAVQAAHDADARVRQQQDQQRRDAYSRLMAQGQTALSGRRFDEAQRSFADALKHEPNDAEATRLLKQAQDAAKPVANIPAPPPVAKAPPPPAPSPAPSPPKPATPVSRPKAFEQWMEAGAALEKQDKFGDALRAYETALRIVANDASAIKRAEYARLMDAGVTALKADRKPDAVREFEAALKAVPNDAAATRYLQQARR